MPGYSKEEQLHRPEIPPDYDEAEEYRICVSRATDKDGVIWCDWCGKPIKRVEDINRHHVKPRSRGGKTHRSNLAAVHGNMTDEGCHRTVHRLGAPGWIAFARHYR